MNDIKITVERGGTSTTYDGKFAVIGLINDCDAGEKLSAITIGRTTAYGAAMLGCQVVAKMVRPFDTMEPVMPDSEV